MIRIGIFCWVITLFLYFPLALACPVPTPGSDWNKDELVQKSNGIVLARFIEDESGFDWQIVETLKPSDNLSFLSRFVFLHQASIRGGVEYQPTDFDAHQDTKFWSGTSSRSGPPASACVMMHVFHVGHTYLLFDNPVNPFAAERIVSEKDAWFSWAKSKVVK